MIRFIRPSLPSPEAWVPLLEASYRARHFSNFGPLHQRFEEELTHRYCEPGRQAVLASSATAALTATLIAMDVRGEVAIPSFTFPATLQAVRQAGCTPLVMDVDHATWELSPHDVLRELEGRQVGAVMPVRAFGFCRDMSEWDDVTRHLGVPVVIDAAAALGGRLPTGQAAGGQGTAEVFSLHATKAFCVGEGGVAFLPEALVPAFRRAINFGLPVTGTLTRGLNGKTTEFHSAIGLAMLELIEGVVLRRNEIASEFRRQLAAAWHLDFPDGVGEPPWQAFPVLLPTSIGSDELVRLAAAEEIELRAYYRPALHSTLGSADDTPSCPTSDRLARHVVCLPLYSDMTDGEAEEVLRRTDAALRTATARAAAE